MHGRDLHEVTIDRSRKQMSLSNVRHLIRDYCIPPVDQNAIGFMAFGMPVRQEPEKDPVEVCFDKALRQLIARSLADDFVQDAARFRLPEGRIRLLVYAPLPESVELAVSAETRRVGRILFVREMPLQTQEDSGEVK
jgi:hypothetical protein